MPETHYSNNPANPFSVAPPSIFGQAPVSRFLGPEAHSLFGNQSGPSNGSRNLFENPNDVSFGSGVRSGSCKERGDGKRRVRRRRRGSGRNKHLLIPHISVPQLTGGKICGEHPGDYQNHTNSFRGGSEHPIPNDAIEKRPSYSSTQKPSGSKRGRGRKKKTPLPPQSSFAPGFSSAVGPINPAFGLVDPIFPVANTKKTNRRRRSRK
jgi:hypothetical protein